MKSLTILLMLMAATAFAAQPPVVRSALTTNTTAATPSTGFAPVWNGTGWGFINTNTLGSSSGGAGGTNFGSAGITNFFRLFPQTNALAGAGTTNLVIDGNQSALVRCTVGANFGLLFTNLIDGQEITVEVKQDSTGIRLGTVPNYGNVKFGTDITGLTFSTNAAYIDVLKAKVRNTNAIIVGFVRGYSE